MQEIENELSLIMRKNVYIDFVDKNEDIPESIDDDLKSKFLIFRNAVRDKITFSSVHGIVRTIIIILTICWIIIVCTKIDLDFDKVNLF